MISYNDIKPFLNESNRPAAFIRFLSLYKESRQQSYANLLDVHLDYNNLIDQQKSISYMKTLKLLLPKTGNYDDLIVDELCEFETYRDAEELIEFLEDTYLTCGRFVILCTRFILEPDITAEQRVKLQSVIKCENDNEPLYAACIALAKTSKMQIKEEALQYQYPKVFIDILNGEHETDIEKKLVMHNFNSAEIDQIDAILPKDEFTAKKTILAFRKTGNGLIKNV